MHSLFRRQQIIPPKRPSIMLTFWFAMACTAPSQDMPNEDHTESPSRAFISWKEHLIDDSQLAGVDLRGADGLAVADLDRDGHLDIVSVHEDSSHLRIAYGTSSPDTWERYTLASGDIVNGCEDVAISDFNGDGWLDLVVANENGHLSYFQSAGTPRTVSTWHTVMLSGTLDRGSWIRVSTGDINGDGRPDILATNKVAPGQIGTYSWFALQGDGTDPNSWTETVIGRAVLPINARAADLDQDGDLDVVAGSRGEEAIYIFENKSDGRVWARHPVHVGRPPLAYGFMFELDDLNGDNRIDIITSSGPSWNGTETFPDAIHWFEHPQTLDGDWQPHFLGSIHPDRSTGLELLDIDGDGDKDLFVGGYNQYPWDNDTAPLDLEAASGRLAWFERTTDLETPWHRHDVSRRKRGMFDMFVSQDMNGDGLIDLITTRGNSAQYDSVIWLEQIQSTQPIPTFTAARGEDSPEIPIP